MVYYAPILPMLITLVAVVLWNANGAIYLYRLARYFQLEGYDNKRFSSWFFRSSRERRYCLFSLVSGLIMLIAAYLPNGIIYDFFSSPEALEAVQQQQQSFQFWVGLVL